MELEQISSEEFKEAENLPPTVPLDANTLKPMDEAEFKAALTKLNNPVTFQKELAVRVKNFLDHRMDRELKENDGVLSDHTRKWAKEFNIILESIQRAIHGDKHTHLHGLVVSHSQIAMQIRKHKSAKVEEEIIDADFECPSGEDEGSTED